MKNPLGINEKKPVFGYLLQSEEPEDCQTARRILAATSEDLLDRETGDLWDSGRREDSKCFAIRYEGKPLKSGQKVYWRVKVWNRRGEESDWSETGCFEIGLTEKADWKGIWIGQGEKYQGNQSAAPVFEADFQVENMADISGARAYISGLGLFAAYLNGIRLSENYFEPGESDATRSVYYCVYDVGSILCEGKNTLSVILGNGQYTGYTIEPVMVLPDGTRTPEGRYQKNDSCFVKPGICGRKKLIAQISVAGEDRNSRIVLASDSNWRWTESPVVFQNWYGGEDYDACREEALCRTENSDRSGWYQAQEMKAPEGRLVCRECPPIKIKESSCAKEVTMLGPGHFLVDMGKNGAGFAELRLPHTTRQDRGKWIRMYPAELLNEKGTGVDQRSCTQSWNERYQCVIRDSYRMKGTGEERWHPSFCYHGFRYIEITGFPGVLKPEQILYHRLYADNEQGGTFFASNETVNRICSMTDRSIESNMYWSFTDCPQIEKLGWIETSHLMFRSVASVFDIRAWMKKILRDIRDSQVDEEQAALPGNEEAGFVPGIIPEYYRIKGLYRDPNWNGACVFTPWEYYRYYGDESVLQQAFPVMERYLRYLEKYAPNGVLENYAQMGEWGEYQEHTPDVLVATCSYYRMLQIAAQTADILNRKGCGDRYRQRAEKVKEAFYRHPDCYDPVSGRFGSGSQASCGCVLFSGMADGGKKQDALKQLIDAISGNDFHLTSGEVGLRQVFCALAENGRSDIVYRMMMNRTAPSYRFFADRELSTLPEYWNYEELWHGMVRSRNHAMMGHIREWLTGYLLGIRQTDTAWKTIEIEPYVPDDMDEAAGTVFTPWGTVSAAWKKRGEKFFLKASVPPGIIAEIKIPDAFGGKRLKTGSGSFSGQFCCSKKIPDV